MATEFLMPQLGLTMTEGVIDKWLKRAGETVEAGEALVQISTDKITNEIESPVSGVVLRLFYEEGATVPVQKVLALIGEPGESTDGIMEETGQKTDTVKDGPAAPATHSSPPLPAATQGSSTRAASGSFAAVDGASAKRVKATPLAKKIAKEQGIDLTLVTGTGINGRIVADDVYAASTATPPVTVAVPASSAPGSQTALPLTGIRKVIAERMSASWHNAPHVHMTVAADMTRPIRLKERLTASHGHKFSFTEIVMLSVIRALQQFPMVNATFTEAGLTTHQEVNLGLAVALEHGLIVPVIHSAQQKTLPELRLAVADLASRAKEGQLTQDECQGGTFTLSNLGMFGVDHFTPIINPPECAILGICRIEENPVVHEGIITVRPMMNLSLGFDHRIIDGAVAAQFLRQIKTTLEEPLLML